MLEIAREGGRATSPLLFIELFVYPASGLGTNQLVHIVVCVRVFLRA